MVVALELLEQLGLGRLVPAQVQALEQVQEQVQELGLERPVPAQVQVLELELEQLLAYHQELHESY